MPSLTATTSLLPSAEEATAVEFLASELVIFQVAPESVEL
jgi:hypothetical protein